MVQKPGRHCLLYRTARHRPVAGRQRPTGEKGWGNSGPVTRASLHSSPATIIIMYFYPTLNKALIAPMIHIELNMIFFFFLCFLLFFIFIVVISHSVFVSEIVRPPYIERFSQLY